jgi:hypothetical protein
MRQERPFENVENFYVYGMTWAAPDDGRLVIRKEVALGKRASRALVKCL